MTTARAETPVSVDELRRLEAAATPGPWTHRHNHKPYRIVVFGGKKAYDAGYTTSDIEPADAALIAAARNALPLLLDVAEAAAAMSSAMTVGGEDYFWDRYDDVETALAALHGPGAQPTEGTER